MSDLLKEFFEQEEWTLVTRYLCKTLDIGINDYLFGGRMLALLDEAGAVFASEMMSSKMIVTKLVDKVEFKLPVKVNQLIHFMARVKRFGTTSLTIEIEAIRVNPMTGHKALVCKTEMVFVNIDEDGRPVAYHSAMREAGANLARKMQSSHS